jgi:hypothetical protein
MMAFVPSVRICTVHVYKGIRIFKYAGTIKRKILTLNYVTNEVCGSNSFVSMCSKSLPSDPVLISFTPAHTLALYFCEAPFCASASQLIYKYSFQVFNQNFVIYYLFHVYYIPCSSMTL